MLWELISVNAAVCWLVMSLAFLLATRLKNATVADIFWPFGFMLIALTDQQLVGTSVGLNRSFLLVWFFILLWSTRLTIHNLRRFDRNREDWRYASLRRNWGKDFNQRAYWRVFMLKAVFMLLISLPLALATSADNVPAFQLVVGSLIFGLGLSYETIADWQLFRFRSNPKNKQKIFMGGLWRYSRHPNYLGEIVLWWGIFIVAAGSYWWLALLSPVSLSFLILRVAGVVTLEPRWARSKQYRLYQKRTPRLWPSYLVRRPPRTAA